MTREEIIQGLQFTIDMFLFGPTTGEMLKEPRNDMDKTTIDACKGAIEALEQEPCEDAISRQAAQEGLTHLMDSDGFRDSVGYVQKSLVRNMLNNLAFVQPKIKTGHWIKITPSGIYVCSECEKTVMTGDIDCYKYCNQCGAKMESE